MRSTFLKLVSVACALIMVLTIFQVAVTNVSADAGGEMRIDDPAAHDHRQLTISNYGASEPSFIIQNGTLHVAWIDATLDGVRLDYKHSFDNGTTFSPDTPLTPAFFSIDNISLASSGPLVSISFEGRLTVESNRTVYVLVSSDNGSSWSRTYQVCDGSSPSVAVQNDALYLGLIRPYENSSVFAILEFELDGNDVVNATSVMAMETGNGIGRIAADGSSIHYSVYCTSPYLAVVHGSIDRYGTQVDAISLLASYSFGSVADLDLISSDGKVFVAWTYNSEYGSVVSAAFSSDRIAWNSVVVSHGPGAYGKVSAATYRDGFFVAWENGTRAWTEISASAISSTGEITVDAATLSTDRVDSSSPSVAVDQNGEINAVWTEAHRHMSELFMFQDVLYDSLTFDELDDYIASLDDSAFNAPSSKAWLLDRVASIKDDIENENYAGALDTVSEVMATVDGFAGGSWSDDVVLPFAAQEKIYDVLAGEEEELSSMVAPSLSGAGSMSPMATSQISRVSIESLTATSVTISWKVSLLISANLQYGTTTSYGNSVSGGIGTNQQATVTDLLPGTTYHYRIGSLLLGYTDDRTFTTLSAIYGIEVVAVTARAATISWCTYGSYQSELRYGTTTSYGGVVSGGTNNQHVVTVTSLSPVTTYHFCVVASSSAFSESSSDRTFTTLSMASENSIEVFTLDVGTMDDMTITSHLPGISLLSGTGWSNVVGGMRESIVGSSFLLNLNDNSHQTNTGYLITVTYVASQNVVVQVLNGGVWVDVATLPGNSGVASVSSSFVLEPKYMHDSQSSQGINVQLRFADALKLDYLHAVSYTYTTNLHDSNAYHIPGVYFETGWVIGGNIANGSIGASVIVSLPKLDTSYALKFECLDGSEIEVEQLISSGYVSLGSSSVTRGLVTFILDSRYYDADPSLTGTNIRVRLAHSMSNVTSITLYPVQYTTGVGIIGDNDVAGQLPGICIDGSSGWSLPTTVNGKTVRQTTNDQASFLMNAVMSDIGYFIKISYKSNNAGGIYVQRDISSWALLGLCIISQHREGSRIMISWISSRCQKRGHLVHFVWSDRNAGDARVRNSEADT